MPPLPEVPAPIFLPSELPAAPQPPVGTQIATAPAPQPAPPPAVALAWSATIGEQGLTLQGLVPNQQAREAMLAQARQLAPGGDVVDRLTLEPN
ncbi:MAG: hypothetical protein DCF30_17460, partial [Hyphomicrobiales bacterium]